MSTVFTAPTRVTTAPAANAQQTPATPAATKTDSEVRGFALYVGLTEAQLAAAGVTLAEIVTELKNRVNELTPDATSHATIAVAPKGIGGLDIDVTRLALGEPAAKAARARQRKQLSAQDTAKSGVTIDLARGRVLLDNIAAPFTYREFELLQFFILREGQTITREDIINQLWQDCPAEEAPNARTIDVHIRRLRVKLAQYQDIIRTVRGAGYRFDRHADVQIITAQSPSPDF